MRKLTSKDIKLKGEGVQLKGALFYSYGNDSAIYKKFEYYRYSPSTVDMNLRKKMHPPSKFIQAVELILGKPYANIVETVPAQMRRLLNMIRSNSQYYDSASDLDMLDRLKEQAVKYDLNDAELEIELRTLKVYFAMGEVQTVIDMINIGKEAHGAGYYDVAVMALCEAATSELSIGRHDSAMAIMDTGIRWRKMASKEFLAMFDMTIGMVTFKRGEWAKAANYFDSAYREFECDKDRCKAAMYVARCYVKSGDVDKGVALHHKVLMDDPGPETEALINMYIARSLKRPESTKYIRDAVEIIMDSNVLPDTIVEVLNDYYKHHNNAPKQVVEYTIRQLPFAAHSRYKAHLLPELVERVLDSIGPDHHDATTDAIGDLIDGLDFDSAGDKNNAALISKVFAKAIKKRKYWFERR